MLKNHRLVIVLFCAATLAGTYCSSVQRLESIAFDLFSYLMPQHAGDSKTAVIAIDQKSMDGLGEWPWSRHDLANLVAHLHDARVKAIGILLPLDQPQNIKDKLSYEKELSSVSKKLRKEVDAVLKKLDPDSVFTTALGKNNNVVIAIPYWPDHVVNFEMQSNLSSQPIEPLAEIPSTDPVLNPNFGFLFMAPNEDLLMGRAPIRNFSHAASGLGFSQSGNSGDVIYTEPLVIEWENKYYPSLVLQLVARAYKADEKSLSLSSHESMVLKKQIYPLTYDNAIIPRVSKGAESRISIYSAVDLLNNKKIKKSLKNKVALIGFTAAGFAPYMQGVAGNTFTPVTWAALSTDALLNNEYIQQPNWSYGLQRGLIIALAIYLMMMPSRMRGRSGLIISAVITMVLINISLVLMLTQNMWLMFTIPAMFVVLGHVFISLHNHFVMMMQGMRSETFQAYLKLGHFNQAQGKLDEALGYFKKCPIGDDVVEHLYKLALDYERRRQFSNASSVYDLIAKHDADYKDIKDRRDRHTTLPSRTGKFTNTGGGMTSTVIIDDPQIENTVLGRYQLEEELGRGAMGMVYLGKDPTIGRTVAIKTMALSEEFEDEYVEEVRKRFFIEAETAGRLNHPNIVTIYDAGEEHDLAYIAMDYIKGDPLSQFSKKSNLLPIETVFEIGIKVAEALDYAHQQNVVHRDVKPGNILYDKETDAMKITDFGIACLTDNSKTRSGTVLGSPSYMSPEQLAGVQVDGRSDLFSLGVTLYQLFTGVLPFQADSMAALAYKIINSKAKSVRKERSELPQCVTRIINKAMEKDPKQRYQDGASMADALYRCLN